MTDKEINEPSDKVPHDLKGTHLAQWYEEWQAFKWLLRRSKWFLLLIVLALVFYGFLIYRNWDLNRMKDKLERQNALLTGKAESLLQRLAPFEAIAAKSFPNQEDRTRLDLLIQSINDLNQKYGSFELRRADALEFSKETRAFAEQYTKENNKKPKVHLVLNASATDSSRRLFEFFRNTLTDGGWDVTVYNDLLRIPAERGLWLNSKNLREPSKQYAFWGHLFVKFGLNLKSQYWDGNIADDEVVLVINDPSYIR